MNWLRLHVSNLCNFKCPNCHVFELGENILPSRVMSEDIFFKSISVFTNILYINNHKEVTISLYGGETLANKKMLKNAIAQIGSAHNNINITWVLNTNGSLLKEEDVLFFKKNNVEIHISVDGKEEVHNISRPTHKGKGTFHLVKPALELLKKYDLISQINSYVMPSNYLYLNDLVDIAKDFNIKKIYLDQFYNLEMFNFEMGMEKYREVYFYGAQNDVIITGPWQSVLFSKKSNSKKENIKKRFTLDVNIDGSCYIPTLPQYSKKMNLNLENLESFYISGGWALLLDEIENYYNKQCHDCSLFASCFGTAINQVQYHIGDDADVSISCDFFKKWVTYLERPIYFTSKEKYKVISVLPENKIEKLIMLIEQKIFEIEEKIWNLSKPIIINISEYRVEFLAACKQSFLPEWSHATTSLSNILFHLGGNPSPGIAHELVHLFLNDANSKMPAWLIEGFCEYIQDGKMILSKSELMRSKELLQVVLNSPDDKKILLIEHDNNIPEKNVLYTQARLFIEYLILLTGKEAFFKIAKDSQNFEADLNYLTGHSLKENLKLFFS